MNHTSNGEQLSSIASLRERRGTILGMGRSRKVTLPIALPQETLASMLSAEAHDSHGCGHV